MKPGLYVGDICRAPVEVICTSTNPHLDLMLGTGGAVREAGGSVIQEECNALIAANRANGGPAYLKQGSVARTGAGRLPFRTVIHCVAIDAFHDSTREAIVSCVRGALIEAARMSPPARSILFPALASGNGNYDFEKSVDHIAEIVSAETPPCIEQVWIMVKDGRKKAQALRVLEARLGKIEILEPSPGTT